MTVEPGLAADEVAVVFGCERLAVRWIAHRAGWRRFTWGGRVYYHPADVEATLDKRVAKSVKDATS